jgi:hypothetical protein
MSHAFSLIIRGRIDEALSFNEYSLRLFLFFALQLPLRVFLSLTWLRIQGIKDRNRLVVADTVISSGMFLLAFFPLIRYVAGMAVTIF